MKKKQQTQNQPNLNQPNTTPKPISNKSNSMIAMQLKSLLKESASKPTQKPTLNIGQAQQLCSNPKAVVVPIPNLEVVAEIGLDPKDISVPIPNLNTQSRTPNSTPQPQINNPTVQNGTQNSTPQTQTPSINTGNQNSTPQIQTPNLDMQNGAQAIPEVTAPLPDLTTIGFDIQEVETPIPNIELSIPSQDIEVPTPSSSSNSAQGGSNTSSGGGSQRHKIFHKFNNHDNQDISLHFTGGIQSVVAESKTARDGLFSTGNDAKHYTITLVNDTNHLHVTPGDEAAGGANDSGIVVAKVKKVAPKQFKVWFNRGKGANTYVNEFGIEGI